MIKDAASINPFSLAQMQEQIRNITAEDEQVKEESRFYVPLQAAEDNLTKPEPLMNLLNDFLKSLRGF